MRFEPRRAFFRSKPFAAQVDVVAPELSFLRLFRHDGEAVLARATAVARAQKICPARALIASGDIGASIYYRALADHLGLPFEPQWPQLAPATEIAHAYAIGCVKLADGRWLLAPTDEPLQRILRARRDGLAMPDIVITTPAHLAALIELRAQGPIERVARDGLPATEPRLSAYNVLASRRGMITALALLAGSLVFGLAPRLTLDGVCLLFFAATVFRLLVCARSELGPRAPWLSDAALPVYTVLVPLRGEAGMVADLLRALAALDYPRAKLEISVLWSISHKRRIASPPKFWG